MKNMEFSTAEYSNNEELRKTLIEVAEHFLMDDQIDTDISKMSNEELGEYVQTEFQSNIETFFETSGLAEEIKACKTDDEVLHVIANKAEGVHGWVDMLPNLVKSKPGVGMNCTMGSAMLHLALEKLGYKSIRTVFVAGHHVAVRELEDGSIKVYDASSTSTVDGRLVGYSHVFNPEQISNRIEVEERAGRKGYAFTLDRGKQDEQGGFHVPDKEGKFTQKMYAYDPGIKMDVAVALGNLHGIKDDAERLGGLKDLPLFDDSYRASLAEFIKRNNQTELTDEEIRKIKEENPDVMTTLLRHAEQTVREGRPAPNPFDFIKSSLLIPKEKMEAVPDPRDHIKEAELRHNQAKELVTQYPELKKLNADEIK
jgi:hypothetical protein